MTDQAVETSDAEPRREQQPSRPIQQRGRSGVLIWLLIVAVFSLVFIGGGVFILFVQQTGERTSATVTECEVVRVRPTSYACYGTWIQGGSLLAGGKVVRGLIDGAHPDDVGQTIPVALSGDRAYTVSLRLPFILIAIGVAFLVVGVFPLRTGRRAGS